LLCGREVVFPVHCAGDPDLTIQKVSARQTLQAASEMLPVFELDFPAAHDVQVPTTVAPKDVEYDPGGQL